MKIETLKNLLIIILIAVICFLTYTLINIKKTSKNVPDPTISNFELYLNNFKSSSDSLKSFTPNPITPDQALTYTDNFIDELNILKNTNGSIFYNKEIETINKSIFFSYWHIYDDFFKKIAIDLAGSSNYENEIKKLGIRIYFGINERGQLTTVLRATSASNENETSYLNHYDMITETGETISRAYDIGDPCPSKCPTTVETDNNYPKGNGFYVDKIGNVLKVADGNYN